MNVGFSVAANLLGVRFDPYSSYNFLVEIEGLLVGGFSQVSGLQAETTVETYREGGLNEYEHKLAGPTTYSSNLVLKHGLIDLDLLWQWHEEIRRGNIIRRNGTIYLLDNRRLPAMWWDFLEAYPVKWIGPDLQAGSSAVALETIELVHHGIVKPTESTALSAARGAVGGAAQLF
ncbi:MAG: phage tail protein [Anaerolineales bacterium]|nr:phage tail protein [Anaerolineales bacterium]